MRLPVHCPDCGGVFASRGFDIEGTNASLWGNKETCIFCRSHRAELSNGVFNIAGDVIEIVSAPDVTYKNFKRLAALVTSVKTGGITPEAAIEEAEKIKPGYGAIVANWIALNLIGVVALLFAVYQWHDTQQSDEKRDRQLERLITAVERSIARQIPHAHGPQRTAGSKNRNARRADAAAQRKADKTKH